MISVFSFLPFFPSSFPKKLPLQQLSLCFFYLLKNRVSSVISLKPFFLYYCSANSLPLFFQIFIIYNTQTLQKQKNKKFLWIQTKLQQLISHELTFKNKSSPTHPAISRQKVDQTELIQTGGPIFFSDLVVLAQKKMLASSTLLGLAASEQHTVALPADMQHDQNLPSKQFLS